MRIAVTIVYDEQKIWKMLTDGCSWSHPLMKGRNIEDVAKQFPAKVQFCGKWFDNGQTIEMEVFDSYDVRDSVGWNLTAATYQNYDSYDSADMCTHILGEWPVKEKRDVLFRYGGCKCTGHIWSGHSSCGCNKVVCGIFTPHELMQDRDLGSVTTHEGVTIAWERIKEESKNEKSDDITHDIGCHDDDRVCLDQRW